MSKKTRGTTRTTRHRRPGAPGTSRPAGSRPVPARQSAEEPFENTLAASQLAQTPDSEATDALPAPGVRAEVRSAHARPRAKPGSLLAARAATEYVYVAQDLKRITLLGVLLFGGLILLWLAIVVLRLIPLPFY